MSDQVGGISGRLQQVFQALGLAILTPFIGVKRAGDEHLLSYRVAIGGMIAGAVATFTVAALGLGAGGVAARAAIGIGMGVSFFGAFGGMLLGLVLRVNAPPSSETLLRRKEAEQKKDMKS